MNVKRILTGIVTLATACSLSIATLAYQTDVSSRSVPTGISTAGTLGDVNGDGVINVTDITKIAAHIKGKKMLSADAQKLADINGDGNINVTDISKVAAHVKGKRLIGDKSKFKYSSVPAYKGSPSVSINRNTPYFDDYPTNVFETYSNLDSLGRCGVAYANICKELMPTEQRGEIGSVKPTGWHTTNYHEYIDDIYLYNRCHLVAFMLAGENANEKNLITGTRYMNTSGMLPYEEKVRDYINANPKNHVLYRVTPVFVGSELVARGVLMEAYSVEDGGTGVEFCVFCYNVQPYITIDYSTGDSHVTEKPKTIYCTGDVILHPKADVSSSTLAVIPTGAEVTFYRQKGDNWYYVKYNNIEGFAWKTYFSNQKPIIKEPEPQPEPEPDPQPTTYVLNTNTKKFHYQSCSEIKKMKPEHKAYDNNRTHIISMGYVPCKRCNP